MGSSRAILRMGIGLYITIVVCYSFYSSPYEIHRFSYGP